MDTQTWLPTLPPDSEQRARMQQVAEISDGPNVVALFVDEATQTMWRRTDRPDSMFLWHVKLGIGPDASGTADPTHYAAAGDRVDFDDGRAQEARDAARWRALTNCARISIVGSARLGQPDAHIGLELWGEHPDERGYFAQLNAINLATLEQFLDGLRRIA